MLLPAFQEVVDLVYGSTRLRALGMMDCRHSWERGRTVIWSVFDTPSLSYAREGYDMIQGVRVQHRTVEFRMKEIVADPGVVSMTDEHWMALMLEEGRLADLAFIEAFHERDLDDPRLTYALDRLQSGPPARVPIYPCPESPAGLYEPAPPIATTTASAGALTMEHIRRARDLLMHPDRNMPPFAPEPSTPPTVEEIADRTTEYEMMAEANTRPEAVTAPGESRYRSVPSCDPAAPAHAEPLAPLPDWMKKVDEILGEAKR